MKQSLTFILLSILLSAFAGNARSHEKFVPDDPSNKYIVGDSIWRFANAPWKCVLITPSGDSITRYYRRDGVEKARVNGSYFAAMNQDPDNRDYYETYRTYKTGETRLVRNWYNYGADFNSKHNSRRYYYTPQYNDSHGNWVMACDIQSSKKETFRRMMVYYDEARYSESEDAAIDARIAGLVSAVKEQENPLNPANLAASAFNIAAKALYLFGLFLLFMLVFRRGQLYFWIDRHAGRIITPSDGGLFCKVQLAGIIPSLLILAPAGLYLYNGHSTAVIHLSLVVETLYGIGAAVVYSLIYVLIRRRSVFTRTAIWELLYAIACCLCLWATVILGIYIAVIALIVLFFAGMVFGKGGTLPADEGPENAYVTSWDGEGEILSKMGPGDYYMDTAGNLYRGSGNSFYRLGDGKRFQ